MEVINTLFSLLIGGVLMIAILVVCAWVRYEYLKRKAAYDQLHYDPAKSHNRRHR